MTQAAFNNQDAVGPAFCENILEVFNCLACMNDCVNPGDVCCSPTCVCAAMPPFCP